MAWENSVHQVCRIDTQLIERAVVVLKEGGLVAFPTESWYGLAVDPLNKKALERLFAVKQRPESKPIPVLVGNRKQLHLLVREVPSCYSLLMQTFWPGPLTLVFPARVDVPASLTAGTGTVALRHSSHPVAARLAAGFGGPITATSANISGAAPQTTAQDVAACFKSDLDMILDGGRTPGGRASTVVSCLGGTVSCLREGQIAFDKILAVVNR